MDNDKGLGSMTNSASAVERLRASLLTWAGREGSIVNQNDIHAVLDTLAEKESELKGAYELLHATEDKAVAKESEVQALREVIDHTVKTIERQLDLIGERAPGKFLDKTPVMRSLQAHVKRLSAALNPKEDQ